MAAITAPGMTPAVAIPTTISGAYARDTFNASARDSSPKSGHSTLKTPFECSTEIRRGLMVSVACGWWSVAKASPDRDPCIALPPGPRRAPPAATPSSTRPSSKSMSWWSRLVGGKSGSVKPQRLDYLSEALALERQGDFDAALTSYRLALRDRPNDPKILENMAIAFSKTGRLDDAVRWYRRSLEIAPELSGAHYGLAFLLFKRGDAAGGAEHLKAFLAHPLSGAEADRWVRHAEETLETLRHDEGLPKTDM